MGLSERAGQLASGYLGGSSPSALLSPATLPFPVPASHTQSACSALPSTYPEPLQAKLTAHRPMASMTPSTGHQYPYTQLACPQHLPGSPFPVLWVTVWGDQSSQASVPGPWLLRACSYRVWLPTCGPGLGKGGSLILADTLSDHSAMRQ